MDGLLESEELEDAAEVPAPLRKSRAEIARCVLELLGPTPVSVDEIVRASEAPARDVRAALLELELAGRLERRSGDLVSLAFGGR